MLKSFFAAAFLLLQLPIKGISNSDSPPKSQRPGSLLNEDSFKFLTLTL